MKVNGHTWRPEMQVFGQNALEASISSVPPYGTRAGSGRKPPYHMERNDPRQEFEFDL